MRQVYSLNHYQAIKESVLSDLRNPRKYYLVLSVLTDEWQTARQIAESLKNKTRCMSLSLTQVSGMLRILYLKGLIERKKFSIYAHAYRLSPKIEWRF